MLSCIRDVQSMINVWTELGDLSVGILLRVGHSKLDHSRSQHQFLVSSFCLTASGVYQCIRNFLQICNF